MSAHWRDGSVSDGSCWRSFYCNVFAVYNAYKYVGIKCIVLISRPYHINISGHHRPLIPRRRVHLQNRLQSSCSTAPLPVLVAVLRRELECYNLHHQQSSGHTSRNQRALQGQIDRLESLRRQRCMELAHTWRRTVGWSVRISPARTHPSWGVQITSPLPVLLLSLVHEIFLFPAPCYASALDISRKLRISRQPSTNGCGVSRVRSPPSRGLAAQLSCWEEIWPPWYPHHAYAARWCQSRGSCSCPSTARPYRPGRPGPLRWLFDSIFCRALDRCLFSPSCSSCASPALACTVTCPGQVPLVDEYL